MSDREESPDWLREFQAPRRNIVTLSSASETSSQASPRGNDDSDSSYEKPEIDSGEKETILLDSGEDSPVVKTKKTKPTKAQKNDKVRGEDSPGSKSKKTKNQKAQKDHIVEEDGSSVIKTKKTKSTNARKDLKVEGGHSPVSTTKKRKTTEAQMDHNVEDPLDAFEEEAPDEEAHDEDVKEKPSGLRVSERLPLVLPDKVQRTKALVECDGDSIDLSGDIGAVGRIVVADGPAGNPEMLLDMKGTIYKSTIVPSRTFCIVSIGQSEAKIEAIMSDFIKLEPQSNLFEAETMIEGTLEGFSFDSDEEGDKMPKPPANPSDPNNENEDQSSSKKKRKAEKSLGPVKKKGKAAARPPKTVKKTKKTKK